MNVLVSTIYRHGSAGLSNLIMSLELGVVAARLTDRALVLKGNKTPKANIVQYGGRVSNRYPSRVTDLIDPGMPWADAESVDLAAYAMHDICPQPAWRTVFYLPSHLSLDSADFKAFSQNRPSLQTVTDEILAAKALSLTGGDEANTLCFYSTFFYLDRSSQQSAFDALRNMKPRPELSEFANKVAGELGDFNAVHIRRGDFKKTMGVTTLNRTAAEVIQALDHHFSRDDLLMVVTDEAEDPFFDEVRAAYKSIVFIDHHILDNHGQAFLDLPAHDSIALAYLSQLVAAHSRDFIGTMTSTFTSMIQRMRGNMGKPEPFKFLWNELPPEGAKVEPGRHADNEDVLLDKGVMVEERDGPYSWNRFNQRLNSAWMREWPESFLNEEAMLARADTRDYVEPDDIDGVSVKAPTPETVVSFLGETVLATSDNDDTAQAIARLFALMTGEEGGAHAGHLIIEDRGGAHALMVDGELARSGSDATKLLRRLYREVVRCFIAKHPELVWLHAACAARDGEAVVMPGTWGQGKSTLALELCNAGWAFMSDDIVPIDPVSGAALPFPATPQVRPGALQILSRDELSRVAKRAVPLDSARVANAPQNVAMLVFPHFIAAADTQLTPISAGQAASRMLETCLSFPENSDPTIQALCKMTEGLAAYTLQYSDPTDAVRVLIETRESRAA